MGGSGGQGAMITKEKVTDERKKEAGIIIILWMKLQLFCV